jgi:hypothetical protein
MKKEMDDNDSDGTIYPKQVIREIQDMSPK